MDTLEGERPRITIVPDWLLLAIGLVGTVAFLAAVTKFMPKEERPRAAPLPDHPRPPLRRPEVAAEDGGSDDDDDGAADADAGGAGGGTETPQGTREERRAHKKREKARLKDEARARTGEEADASDGLAGELESARRAAHARKKESAEAEAQELRDEAHEFAAWRAAKNGGGSGGGALAQLTAALRGGGELAMAEGAAGLGCSEAALARRLAFLVAEGALLGVLVDGPLLTRSFVAWAPSELDLLASHVQTQGRVSFAELSKAAAQL